MGSLKGDLSVMSVPDIVIWLANRTRTGRLSLSRGGVRKHLHVVQGQVVQSSSDDPRERLGQHLLNFGYVSEAQLTVAFATQTETGVPLGRVLVMGSVIDDDRLHKVLNYKTRECLLDAFEWEQGAFEFADDVQRNPALDAPTSTHLAEIHGEGTSRRAMWEEIRKLLPGPQYQLEVLAQPPGTLNPFDRRLLEFAMMGRSIGELALEVRALDFHVFARLYDLAKRGLVRAREPSRTPRSAPPPLPPDAAPGTPVVPAAREELLAELRIRLEARELEQAYIVAQRILERDPNNVEALAALQSAQARPTARGAALSAQSIPQLAVARDQLDEYLLTSKERYVLSRVDGKRTLQQIMQVSPIQEVELLRIVEAFVQRGFVTV
ncbi:MAG: DUF4388 domain-containing protein [Deltaproteobacteria bacterium]|nr:DUF4388 domain-containing protein [Deltaproteobacteria bacterium]